MRSKKIKQKKIYFVVVMLVVLGLSYFGYSKLLRITNITWNLNGVDCVSINDLNRNLKLKGKMLFKTDQSSIQEEIVSTYPCVKSISLTKNLLGATVITFFPRTAFLSVSSFEPKSSLMLNNLEATPSSQSALYDPSIPQDTTPFFLADDQGVLFKQSGGNYPTLYILGQRLMIGDSIDTNLLNEVKSILNALASLQAQNEIKISNPSPIIKVEDTYLIVLTSPNLLFTRTLSTDTTPSDIYNSLTSLQLILQAAKMNNQSIQSIDLRFDKPVVRYSQAN